jgi:hypothetical protein
MDSNNKHNDFRSKLILNENHLENMITRLSNKMDTDHKNGFLNKNIFDKTDILYKRLFYIKMIISFMDNSIYPALSVTETYKVRNINISIILN